MKAEAISTVDDGDDDDDMDIFCGSAERKSRQGGYPKELLRTLFWVCFVFCLALFGDDPTYVVVILRKGVFYIRRRFS